MRLLVVSQYFWPETFGINRQVFDLVAEGIDVTVLTGKPNYPSGVLQKGYSVWGLNKENFRGVTIFRIPLIPRGKSSGIRLTLNYLSFVFFGLTFGSWLLRRQQFDAILVYAPSPILQAIPAILFSKLRGIPLTVWVQDLWPQSLSATGYINNRFVIWFVEQLVRWIYNSADLLLVQSQAFVDTVKNQAKKKKYVRFFPNSAEKVEAGIKNILSPEVEKWVSMIRSSFSVVFTGNVGSAQAISTIVDAALLCASNVEICFFVVGTGSESKWLTQEIKKKGLQNIISTGWLAEGYMPELWDASSVLLVTLLNKPIFHQTIPNKLQCYLSAGKPIVASLGGEGARVLEESRAGLISAPENALELASCILTIAAMKDEDRELLGQNGLDYFNKNFDPQILTTKLITMLSDLIDQNEKSKI